MKMMGSPNAAGCTAAAACQAAGMAGVRCFWSDEGAAALRSTCTAFQAVAGGNRQENRGIFPSRAVGPFAASVPCGVSMHGPSGARLVAKLGTCRIVQTACYLAC